MRTWAPARRIPARWAPYAVLAAVTGAVGYVAAVDPNTPGHYPACPFLAITGHYCPGCGSLRMIHDLAHGRPAQAFGENPLTFLTLAPLGYLWVRWAIAARTGRPVRTVIVRLPVVIAFAVLIVVFWVVRNLPAGRALAP